MSKEYCRVTVLMFLVISLAIPPVAVSAYDGPIVAVKKTQAALRTRVSGAWMDESIDKVLMDLADQADVDIVKGPLVKGNVTAKITGVPLAEALTNILAAHGFTHMATDNMIRVTTLSTLALAGVREELISKVYRITYADANDVAGALAKFVSDKGKVAFNKGTSHILVTDTEKKMKAIDKFITELDRQTQQVLVEVKIYEITTSEGFDLGTAFRAARVIEYETRGAMSPTTTTTTFTPERTFRTDLDTPEIGTETHTPGYKISTLENRREDIPEITTVTDTPGYENITVEARDEDPYGTFEQKIRTGTGPFTETATSTYPGADRTDTTTQTFDRVTTTATTTPGRFTRNDDTTQTFDGVTTTETTDGSRITTTEVVAQVKVEMGVQHLAMRAFVNNAQIFSTISILMW